MCRVRHSFNSCGHQVRLSACGLACLAAQILGSSTPMSTPTEDLAAPAAAAGDGGRGRRNRRPPPPATVSSSLPLLQFGRPLCVADDAYQRLCGLLAVETQPGIRVCALNGLAGAHGTAQEWRHVWFRTFADHLPCESL